MSLRRWVLDMLVLMSWLNFLVPSQNSLFDLSSWATRGFIWYMMNSYICEVTHWILIWRWGNKHISDDQSLACDLVELEALIFIFLINCPNHLCRFPNGPKLWRTVIEKISSSISVGITTGSLIGQPWTMEGSRIRILFD